MEAQRIRPHGPPPPFSPSTDILTPVSPMETEMSKKEIDRSQRAASVLSGMSAEDMEAAETLNSLFTSTSTLPLQS